MIYFNGENMIDVIIPAYNAHKTIEKTLCSIAYQDEVKNLNVYIVNDCSETDYRKEVKYFLNFMNVEELKLDKNVGPGMARQHGIDNSFGKYIVFIDSDDVFSDCFAIRNLIETIDNGNFDIGINAFVEERPDRVIDHINDGSWLHGKIYKREYLKRHRIVFNNSYANEDNGFNRLIFLSGANINYSNKTTYIWKFNINSITNRNNGEYDFTGLEGYIYNMTWAIENAIERKYNMKNIIEEAFSTVVMVYYYYLKYVDRRDCSILEEKIVMLVAILDNNREYLSNNKRVEIMEKYLYIAMNLGAKEEILFPKVTFDQFLNKVKLGEVKI